MEIPLKTLYLHQVRGTCGRKFTVFVSSRRYIKKHTWWPSNKATQMEACTRFNHLLAAFSL